jgi:tripartite-type tricarboxylate transporter receptor subunit TctC
MQQIIRAFTALAVGVLASGAIAQTQDATSFFGGKTVTIIAGSGSGGGVDLYARLIGRHLQKYIPGNPSVVVQNMPGAGSLAAAHHLYSVAPKDGTVMAVVPAPALFDPLMAGEDLSKYDPRKFNYVANANADTLVCVVRKDAPVQSYKDLFEKELVVGGTGPGSALWYYPTMERYVLGVKLKVIAGYKGSNELSLALQRNEIQGVCGIFWSSARQQYPGLMTPGGDFKVIVQHDARSLPVLKAAGVPLSIDFARTAEQKQALEAFLLQGSISRPFILPPDVAPERVAMMRKALADTLKDPDLLAEAKKSGLDLMSETGPQVEAQVKKIYGTSPDILAYLRKGAGTSK